MPMLWSCILIGQCNSIIPIHFSPAVNGIYTQQNDTCVGHIEFRITIVTNMNDDSVFFEEVIFGTGILVVVIFGTEL